MAAQFLSSVMGSQYDSGTGTTTSTDDLFSKVDSDGNGSVSESEFTLSGPQWKPTRVIRQHPRRANDDLFAKIDTDGDGSISESEFSTFQSAMAADGAPPPPPPPSDSSTSSTSSTDSLFGSIDTDGDGSISSDELKSFETQLASTLLEDLTAGSSTSNASSASSTSSASSASATTSTSDQQNGVSTFASLIMEAIGKYMAFSQLNQSSAVASTLNVAG